MGVLFGAGENTILEKSSKHVYTKIKYKLFTDGDNLDVGVVIFLCKTNFY